MHACKDSNVFTYVPFEIPANSFNGTAFGDSSVPHSIRNSFKLICSINRQILFHGLHGSLTSHLILHDHSVRQKELKLYFIQFLSRQINHQ